MPAADKSPSESERYHAVRGQIEFEDGLVAQRLNWFVVSQSFLFTAYAITLGAPVEAAWPGLRQQQYALFKLIPLVALGCCLLIYAAVIAGIVAQVRLRRFLVTHFSAEHLANYPSIQGARLTRNLGMSAPIGLPLVFAGVWIYLFATGYH